MAGDDPGPSFLGAFGGGVLYDALGSYTMAWRIGVALGLAAGIIQVAFALIRPSQPRQMQTAWLDLRTGQRTK